MKSIFSAFFLFSCFFSFSQNLISNGDFENNGNLDCRGWYDGCLQELTYLCDTLQPGNPCDVDFYKDTPEAGDIWSLGVTGVGNGLPGTAITYITGQSGTNVYRFNLWMKDGGQAFGGAYIGIHSHGEYTLVRTITADSMDWIYYTALDTLQLEATDSIEITLWAFAAGPSFGIIYFDQIEFLLEENLSSTQKDYVADEFVVYPNPAHDEIIISKKGEKGNAFTVSLFDVNGRVVLNKNLESGERTVRLNLTSGMYYYRIVSGQAESWGRLVVE